MIETITFAFCAYAKTLHELKATLRGLPFDHILFINDMKMLDDIIVDQCPNNDNYNEQYDKTFFNDFIYKLSLSFCPQFYPKFVSKQFFGLLLCLFFR